MATTATAFSENYQIKLIGTGLESGTWGLSTNQNMERIEQALGGSKLLFDVEAPGGTSTWTEHTNTLLWVTTDTAAAGAAGSEGRNKFVEFSGTVDGNVIVQIRGSASDEFPDRIYFVKNSIAPPGTTITFDMGGAAAADYVLQNGCSAVIYTNGAASKVDNLLATLQVENITFGDEEGPAPADITIKANDATALEIKDSVGTLLNFDTTTGATVVGVTSDAVSVTAALTDIDLVSTIGDINLSSARGDINLSVTSFDGEGGDINLTTTRGEGSEADVNLLSDGYINLTPGRLSGDGAIRINGAGIEFEDESKTLTIRNNSSESLRINSVTSDLRFLVCDTSTNVERTIIPVGLDLRGAWPNAGFDGTADDTEITLASYGMSLKAELAQTTSIEAAAITDVSQIVAQPTGLGELDADYQSLTAVAGTVSNNFYVRDFLVRDGAGTDWNTASYRRGVAIDQEFALPTTLKTWYDLNPFAGTGTSGTVSVGSENATYGSFSSDGLSIGGTDKYLNFDATSGSSGYGIRVNSGVIETKNSGGAWGPLFGSAVSGDGLYYESPELVITADLAREDLAHSISSVPKLITATLRCKIADQGYLVGYEIPFACAGVRNNNKGIIYGANATNCFYAIGTNGAEAVGIACGIDRPFDGSSTSEENLATDSWRLIIRAWK